MNKRQLTFVIQYTDSGAPEWPIVQATILGEYYAVFRGRNKKAYQKSPRFEALYQMVSPR